MGRSDDRGGRTPSPHRFRRFGRTERALHWIHAAAFFALLGTGLALWLPQLSVWVGRRALVKEIHLWTAVAWAVAVVLVIVLGNTRALRAAWREIEAIDRDDRRWLLGRRRPQGRFNAGQKLNAIVTTAFALLFAASGVLLWLSARDSRFRWEGPIVVHDALTLLSVIIVLGHLYLAVVHPTTRHALRGMTLGDVDADWARKHHAKWVQPEERSAPLVTLGPDVGPKRVVPERSESLDRGLAAEGAVGSAAIVEVQPGGVPK